MVGLADKKLPAATNQRVEGRKQGGKKARHRN